MTKLRFSLIVTFSIVFTLGYLVAQTADPGIWTLPIMVITGGSLYASRSLFDQVNKRLKKLKTRAKYSSLGQSSPRMPPNWRKR